MSDLLKTSEDLSPIKRALLTFDKMKAKLDALEYEKTEPIAITGMACRFPGGADSPEKFWSLLHDGVDTVKTVPLKRWEGLGGPALSDALFERYLPQGAFLEEIDQFDPYFFGMSPLEATMTDPQQRLLLEVCWEALERAGQVQEKLTGSQTGVFLGMAPSEYGALRYDIGDLNDLDIYTGLGMGANSASGRISFLLGLQGPNFPVDTACSSSLVATHLACESLRTRGCNMALAGGVNLFVSPMLSVLFTKLGAISPDGHCKAFDASANGLVRGEGVGMVVLKRYADALAAGDPILALIRGSAINHNGRSAGLTVPNGHAQKAVISKAIERSEITPDQISYVEAHGTGTALGDPIEVRALNEALGKGRSMQQPFALGSVKTNIGHTEFSAGIAGLIKTVLALQHKEIPPHLHLSQPNPNIAWDSIPVYIPTTPTPWEPVGGRRIAGVSSFGASGTNAHAILEEAPALPTNRHMAETLEEEASGSPKTYILPLSARSSAALQDLAGLYSDHLRTRAAEENQSLYNICATSSLRRSHHRYRLAAVGHDLTEIAEQLQAFQHAQSVAGLVSGAKDLATLHKIAFVFSGAGSQWVGMGRQLLAVEPVFRASIEDCEEALRPYVQWSLHEELEADEQHSQLRETDVLLPTIFAIQVALAATWRSWGIEPDAVVGHSMGEVAAAYVAGAISLPDAARIICLRSQLLQNDLETGHTALVELSMQECEELLSGYQGRISLAASNGPHTTLISGDPAGIKEILTQLEQKNVFCRLLRIERAAHNPQMDPLSAKLQKMLTGLTPQRASVPLYSTVTGSVCDGTELDAAYWAQNLRHPVLFFPAVRRLVEHGHTIFLELSPHPVLLPSLESSLSHLQKTGIALPSLRRNVEERLTLLESLGTLYTTGVQVAWEKLYQANSSYVQLPTYPWQHEHFWHASSSSSERARGDRKKGLYDHPVLGNYLESAASPGMLLWDGSIERRLVPYWYEHRMRDNIVLPVSAYIELALAALASQEKMQLPVLSELEFQRPLYLADSDDGSSRIQMVLVPDTSGSSGWGVYSYENHKWVLHAKGRALPQDALAQPEKAIDLMLTKKTDAHLIFPGQEYYQLFAARGVSYGPPLQVIERLWLGEGEVIARLHLDEAAERAGHTHSLQPALLDACFQVLPLVLPRPEQSELDNLLYMPVGVERVVVYKGLGSCVWVHASLKELQEQTLVGDVKFCDEMGQVLVTLQGVCLKSLAGEKTAKSLANPSDWLYELAWQPIQLRSQDAPVANTIPGETRANWLIFGDDHGIADGLVNTLALQGIDYTLIQARKNYARVTNNQFMVDPDHLADLRQIFELFATEGRTWQKVLYLWGLDIPEVTTISATELESLIDNACSRVVRLIQEFAQTNWSSSPQIWFVTKGAQTLGAEATPALTQLPLWGLGRVLAVEHAELWGGLIDLDPFAEQTETLAQLIACLTSQFDLNTRADQLALRQGQYYAARLAKKQLSPVSPVHLRADSSYLITGGLGGLGLEVARWMVERGARRLILMNRRALPPRSQWQDISEKSPQGEQIAAVRHLERLGASIHLAPVDVADEASLTAFLEQFAREGWPAIRGVIHTAAVTDDHMLLQLGPEALERVLRPKVAGGWALHTYFATKDIDFFVLFSSLTALLGLPGLANYIAANSFLDGLARHRHHLKLPALSIDWGVWSGVGIGARTEMQRFSRQLEPISMTPAQALEAFELLWQQDCAQIGVSPAAPVQWGSVSLGPVSSLLAEFMVQEQQDPQQQSASLRHIVQALDPDQAYVFVENHMREQLALLLHFDPTRIDMHQPLAYIGLDSVMALQLRNRLNSTLELALSATLLWNYPTLAELVPYLLSQLGVVAKTQAEVVAAPARDSETFNRALADIVDLSDEEAMNVLLEKRNKGGQA
jgi:myxalamid-type polyketide synthase MxaD